MDANNFLLWCVLARETVENAHQSLQSARLSVGQWGNGHRKCSEFIHN